MARLSPWVAPSFDIMSLLSFFVAVYTCLLICGQRICMLCNAAFRFNELNALLASTNMTAYMICLFIIKYLFQGIYCCLSTWLRNNCHLQWPSCFLHIFLHYPSDTLSDNSTDHFSNSYWSATRASIVYRSTISDASNLANRANCSIFH